jgi:hypothetical protein
MSSNSIVTVGINEVFVVTLIFVIPSKPLSFDVPPGFTTVTLLYGVLPLFGSTN